jgi:DNA-binding transcriptional LysR family regulator
VHLVQSAVSATVRKLDRDLGVDEPFVVVPPTWGARIANDRAFQATTLQRSLAYEVPDAATVLEFVRHGLAVAIVPPWMLNPATGVTTTPLRANAPVITFSLATATQRELSTPGHALLTAARNITRGGSA